MTEVFVPAGPSEFPPPIPAAVRQTPRWRWAIHLGLIGVYPMLGLFFRLGTGRSQ